MTRPRKRPVAERREGAKIHPEDQNIGGNVGIPADLCHTLLRALAAEGLLEVEVRVEHLRFESVQHGRGRSDQRHEKHHESPDDEPKVTSLQEARAPLGHVLSRRRALL